MYAKVSDIISDGDGHRQGLEWVGAGGMRCCFRHANVFGQRSGMDDHEDVLITCLEPARFVLLAAPAWNLARVSRRLATFQCS